MGLSGTRLAGQGDLKPRAHAFLGLDGDFSVVRFNEGFHDRETKTRSPGFLRVRFESVENPLEAVRGYAAAVIAHPANDAAFRPGFARADNDFSPRGISDGVGDQVLKNPADQPGVGVGHQVPGLR